jgi:hypothetical protein
MSSKGTGRLAGGRRKAGAASSAQVSEAQEARIARFRRMSKRVGRMKQFIEIVTVIVIVMIGQGPARRSDHPDRSLAGVLSLGFLFFVSLLVSTFLAAGSKYLTPYLPEVLLQSVSSAVSLAFFAALFAMMFKCRRQSPTTTSKLRPCFPRVSTYLKLRESFRARAYVAQLHLIHSTNFMRAAPLDHV